MDNKNDEKYMLRAIELAKKGIGWVNPNPLVGAVIVKNDEIISEGYHRKYGEFHAERDAISKCSQSMKGSTIYVTLEPCCHHGKQPPCTQAIIDAGVSKVVVGSMDPNPLVGGKGIQILKDNGIEVEFGLCKEECEALNPVFFHYIKNKRPYVILKCAQTLDGKIATHKGLSKWITGEEAREQVHKDRHKYSAIMVGVGTVLADDPMLNCRSKDIENPNHPIRIVCDSKLRTPLESKLVQSAKEIPLIIATCNRNVNLISEYEKLGCTILQVSEKDGKTDLNELMDKLGERGIDSIILEGGATLNAQALSSGIVNYVQIYIAPKIFGGEAAKGAIAGKGVDTPAEAYYIRNKKISEIGDDFLIEGEVEMCSRE